MRNDRRRRQGLWRAVVVPGLVTPAHRRRRTAGGRATGRGRAAQGDAGARRNVDVLGGDRSGRLVRSNRGAGQRGGRRVPAAVAGPQWVAGHQLTAFRKIKGPLSRAALCTAVAFSEIQRPSTATPE